MLGVAGRHVQLVGGFEAERAAVVRVVGVLPPPLPSGDGDLERVAVGGRRRRAGLHFPQRARGDQHQEEDDHRRRRGPGDLDRLAAVDLGRLGGLAGIVGAGRVSKAADRVDEHAFDDEEDERGDGEDQNRQVDDRVGGRRGRLEHRRPRTAERRQQQGWPRLDAVPDSGHECLLHRALQLRLSMLCNMVANRGRMQTTPLKK